MSTPIDSLELRIEADSTSAVKSIDSLSLSLSRLKGITSAGLGLDKTAAEIRSFSAAISSVGLDKMKGIQSTLENVSTKNIKNLGNDINEKIENANISQMGNTFSGKQKEVIENFNDIRKNANETKDEITRNIQDLKRQLVSLNDSLKTVSSNLSAANKEVSSNNASASISKSSFSASSILHSLIDDFKSLKHGASSSKKEVADLGKATADLGKGTSGVDTLKSNLGSLGKILLKLALLAAKFVHSVYSMSFSLVGMGVQRAIGTFSALAESIHNVARAFERVALYRGIRLIFSGISDTLEVGIYDFYAYSSVINGEFMYSMDMAATSLLYFKNSVGAAVGSLINALTPALDAVIEHVVALINTLNQFISRLTGKSFYTKAVKQSTKYNSSVGNLNRGLGKTGKSLGNTSKGLGKTGKAAKKASKEIKDATASIDELNIISQPEEYGGGGGGGGRGGHGGGGGGGIAVPGAPDFGTMFEKVPIDSGIAKLADDLKDTIEKQDWKGLGTFLGDKFNEVVDKIPWAKLGQKMGKGINGIISTSYYFLKRADFIKLGKRISQFLNEMIKNIDWEIAGRNFAARLLVLPKLILSTIINLDWGSIMSAITKFFTGFFNELADEIEEIDWTDVGKHLGDDLVDGVENFNPWDIAKAFERLLKVANGALLDLIKGVFSETGKRSVEDYDKGVDDNAIQSKGPLGRWGENIKKWFVTKANNVKFFLVAIDLIKGFNKGMDNNSGDSRGPLTRWGNNIKDWFTGNGVDYNGFSNNGKNIISGFNAGVNNNYGTSKNPLKDWASSVTGWFTGNGVNASSFSNDGRNITNGFSSGVSNNSGSSRNPLVRWAHNVKGWFSGNGANASSFRGIAGDTTRGFGNGINSSSGSSRSSLVGWAHNVKNWFSGNGANYSGFRGMARNVVDGFKSGINSFYYSTKSAMTNWADNVKGWFNRRLRMRSPSRVFMESGKNTILGYNAGVDKYAGTTKNAINDWTNSFMNTQPQLVYSMAVDTSGLDDYISGTYQDTLEANANNYTTVRQEGYADGMKEFYETYMEPTLREMAKDIRRQADKREETSVVIGGQTLIKAVQTQQNANGYTLEKRKN